MINFKNQLSIKLNSITKYFVTGFKGEDRALPNPFLQSVAAFTAFALVFTTFSSYFVNAQSTNVGDVIPQWWQSRGVLDDEKNDLNEGVVNIGQLTWVSTQAYAELESLLPEEVNLSSRYDIPKISDFSTALLIVLYDCGFFFGYKKLFTLVILGFLTICLTFSSFLIIVFSFIIFSTVFCSLDGLFFG